MQRVLFSFCLLLCVVSTAQAHLQPPFTEYLQSGKNICIARVTAIDKDKISFAITEVLRGKVASDLILAAYPSGENYALGSQWLLVQIVDDLNTVGWAMKGDCGWIPRKLIQNNGNVYVKDWTFSNSGIVLDILPDGTKGLTLDHVKQLLEQPPKKN